jgi:hypothetical protein
VSGDQEGYLYSDVNLGLAVTPTDWGQYDDLNLGVPDPPQNAAHYDDQGDINTATPTPVLWWLTPDRGRSPDSIVLVGLGFGDTAAEYNGVVESYDVDTDTWSTVTVTGWTYYAADAANLTDDRKIDFAYKTTTTERQEISIQIDSDWVPPGLPLRVRTDGP